MENKIDFSSLLGFVVAVLIGLFLFVLFSDPSSWYSRPSWKIGDPIEYQERPAKQSVAEPGPMRGKLYPPPAEKKPSVTVDNLDPVDGYFRNVERVDRFDAITEKPNWNEPIYQTVPTRQDDGANDGKK